MFPDSGGVAWRFFSRPHAIGVDGFPFFATTVHVLRRLDHDFLARQGYIVIGDIAPLDPHSGLSRPNPPAQITLSAC